MRSRRVVLVLVIVLLVIGAGVGVARLYAGTRTVGEWQRRLPPWQVELPTPNGWDLYMGATRALQPRQKGTNPAQPSAPTFDAASFAKAVFDGDEALTREWRPLMEAYVARDQTAFDLLHSARSMGCMRPSTGGGLGEPDFLPAYAATRELARGEAGRAALLHLDGKDAEALEAIEDALCMGARMGRGADVIADLVGSAVSGIAGHTGCELLASRPGLSRDRLLQHADTVRVLREQLWPLSQTVHAQGDEELRTVAAAVSEDGSVVQGGPGIRGFIAGLKARGIQAARRRDLPRCLEWADGYYVGLLPLLDKPLWEIDVSDYCARASQESNSVRLGDMAASVLVSTDLAKLVEQQRWGVGTLLAEELAARLAAYRVDHGEYPETLGALVPTCAESIPPDPWTGADPLYRREGLTDYVLYCTGPDRKDDGGEGRPRDWKAPDPVLIKTNWRPPSPGQVGEAQ